MEHINNEEKKVKQRGIAQILMVIATYIVIILFIIAIVVLVKNINEIRTDPISYGIEQKGFDACSCTKSDGLIYHYNSEGPVPTQKKIEWDLEGLE